MTERGRGDSLVFASNRTTSSGHRYADIESSTPGAYAVWFDPALGPHFLRRWAPTRFAWAQRWPPLPSFIVVAPTTPG